MSDVDTRRNRVTDRLALTILGALSYLPALLTSPGRVSADTKTYLYLSPGELLSSATQLWDPNVGAGMVTHQKIGYLWPMGPFFWLFDALRVPDWVAQRLWWGSILFAAGCGVWRLALRLKMPQRAALLAGISYALSPYFLQYLARLSGLLLPWCALPWMILILVRSRGSTSWRWPLSLSFLIATVGTINLTTLLMAIVGVVTWMLTDLFTGTSTWADSFRFSWRLGISSLLINSWWLAALMVQGRYGVRILRYTESYGVISQASTPLEILRGLGYWFFYGGDPRERWVGPSSDYLQNRIVLFTTFALVLFVLVAVARYRGPARFHLGALILVGLGVAVGSSPPGWSSPYGFLFGNIVENEVGFVLRSTPRAAPVVLLALALVTGWTVDRLGGLHLTFRRWTVSQRSPIVLFVCVIAVNCFPWFTGTAATAWLLRDEQVPHYWQQAARAIDETRDPVTGHGRTYEFPGVEFADYVWGGTIDPITPGLIDTGYIAREQVPVGSEPTMDLLSALESRIQERRYDTGLISSFGKLLSLTSFTVRGDLEYQSYRIPSPMYVSTLLQSEFRDPPIYVGPLVGADEATTMLEPVDFMWPRSETIASVAVWRNVEPRAMMTTAATGDLVWLAGSGQGLIDAIGANVVDPEETVLYEASRSQSPTLASITASSHYVLTDSNRRADRSWSGVSLNEGRTERADEEISASGRRYRRLNPFADDPDERSQAVQQSVSALEGDVSAVYTDMYGQKIGLLPEFRAENLVDGDLRTSWRTGGQTDARGLRAVISYQEDVTTASLTVVAPSDGRADRPITEGRVSLIAEDGTVVRTLRYQPRGRRVTELRFPSTTFRRVKFEVVADPYSDSGETVSAPTTGLAEIIVDGRTGREWIRMPSSGLDLDRTSNEMSVVISRWRAAGTSGERLDPEPVVRRIFELGRSREFRLIATARPSKLLAASTARPGVPITANDRLQNSNNSHPVNAVDGDPNTGWVTSFGLVRTPELMLSQRLARSDEPIEILVVDDRRHSVPRAMIITDASGLRHRTLLRRVGNATSDREGARLVRLRADEPSPATTIESVRFSEIDRRTFPDYFTGRETSLPIDVREISLGNGFSLRDPTNQPTECRSDLLTLDGEPLAVRTTTLIGTSSVPRSFDGSLQLESCEPIALSQGEHRLETSDGGVTGLDIDQVTMTTRGTANVVPVSGSSNATLVAYDGRSATVDVVAPTPVVLSFAQSVSRGWVATLESNGTEVDLGEPFVVQGYANGWLVPSSGRVTVRWRPQQIVDRALWLSAASVAVFLMALIVAVWRGRHERRTNTRAQSVRRWWVPWCVGIGLFGGLIPLVASVVGLRFGTRNIARLVGATVGAMTMVIIVLQGHYGYPATVEWPPRFALFAPVTWAVVGLSTGSMLRHADSSTTGADARGPSADA